MERFDVERVNVFKDHIWLFSVNKPELTIVPSEEYLFRMFIYSNENLMVTQFRVDCVDVIEREEVYVYCLHTDENICATINSTERLSVFESYVEDEE